MTNQSPNAPYKNLGLRLQRIRNRNKRSMTEVCGAVEIDERLLARIEAGEEKPPEDLLEQLINHYQIEDQDAINLWTLAGYDINDLLVEENDPMVSQMATNVIMLLALDTRTHYTDALDIHYDSRGVILDFKQSAGQKQPQTVAKLGMSYIQAQQVYETLRRVLLRAKYLSGPKQLSDGSSKE